MNCHSHWNSVYHSKSDAQLSWTQPDPRTSVELTREACPNGRVIDVGGGTSMLADKLLDAGYSVMVLDVSEAAIALAKERLASRADHIDWIIGDITQIRDLGTFDVWHDRALFHFLIAPADRSAYVSLLSRTIPAGGHAIIATFAPDGPDRCSGLPVRRYDAQALTDELGPKFQLVKAVSENHLTPWGKPQVFQFSVFRSI
jgi:2-polyprenyl-3-methyl-5-hydroxy-6-metoxy-1,4-benzoquinol methylase